MTIQLAENQKDPHEALNRMILGRLDLDVAGGLNVVLTDTEAQYATINCTGALTANISVIAPDETKTTDFINATSGAFTLTVKTLSGTGKAITQGKGIRLHCDGTNVVNAGAEYTP